MSQLMELLKKEVRSQLLAAKEGLSPEQLEQEYLAMVGRPLPLRELGFSSTMELVASMPGVVQICPRSRGGVLLKAVADEKTKDISKLISRQKSSGKARNVARKQRAAYLSQNQRGLPPKGKSRVLPAAVKRELQDLLSSSPILLLDFNDAYYTRFKRTFQYKQYGFLSIFEVFESMSDIITVKETRRGSLITLKKGSSTGSMRLGKCHQCFHFSSVLSFCLICICIGPRENNSQVIVFAVLMAEMPPLEPSYETEIFHQATEEKSEPVDAQHQDLEQSRLDLMTVTPDIPPDAVQDRRLCSLPPLETRCLVGVTVNLVVSPSEFYIHIYSAETSDKLGDLMIEMRWYQVIIHCRISDQEVEVFYPDYGNMGIVQKSWLRFLKWCYLKLPAQAIPCSLAWVKPVEDTWTSEATLQFQELCYSKVLVGIVDEYVNGILHLFLCDTSSEEDVYVHSVLKDKGYADICKENLHSQGFKELNPLALYVQSSAKQESAELAGPDLCLQQDSLGADNEASSSRLDREELCNQVGIWLWCSHHSKESTPEVEIPCGYFYVTPYADDEKMKNKDLPEDLALVQHRTSALSEQEVSWKLYVPPTTLSAVLATAARLATWRGYFHWLPGPRKKL
uniref:Tudor domain-containing protein 5 n=1 Tax=Coturnix japonica TaxID=93934 RepID=A0A8C2UH77_COTJA